MIYPIIVAYNRFCGNSPTCEAVKNAGIAAVVCDNSTNDYGNEKYCRENGFNYISMNGNKGLSKAYNKALDFLSEKEGYALILDDDTNLGADFFEGIEKIANSSDATLVLPIVYSNNLIISPCIKNGARIISPKNVSEIKYDNISAINSGMLVNLKYFKNYRYDENMFLDYIDHDFMDDFRKSGEKLVVADNIAIKQEFFGMTVKDKKAIKVRYNLFKRDFIYYAEKHGLNKLIANLILLKRKMKTIF